MGNYLLVSRPEDIRSFGRNAAALLGQLDYWLTKAAQGNNRHVVRLRGQAWVAKSRADWCEETLLTPQQLRMALERLKAAGVIKVERHLFDNRVTAFIRIDGEARQAILDLAVGTRTDLGAGTHTDLGVAGAINKEKTQGRIKKDYGPAEPSVDKGEPEEKEMGTVADVLAGRMRTPQVPVTPSTASKPAELALVFKTAWAETYPEVYLPSFHAKHLGQLKQIAKACPGGAGGKVVDHCVRHWPDFVSKAVADQGAWKQPQLPDLGFMLSFVQSAVNSWMGGSQPKPTTHKSTKPPKVATCTKDTAPKALESDEPVASIDEVAKMLGLGD